MHASRGRCACSSTTPTQDEYRGHLEWKQPKDDAVKEALALLSAAGISKDNLLRFPIIVNQGVSGQTSTQLLQSQWKRLSQGIVDVEIKLLTPAQLDTSRGNRSFSYDIFGQSVGPVEPDLWLGSIYQSEGSQNFMGLSDPQLDAMIEKQRAIFDEGQRKAAIKELVLYLIDHGPSTIGANVSFLHAVQPKIHDYQPETHFLNGRQFQWVWTEG